jgi:phosphosulfolactate synthase
MGPHVPIMGTDRMSRSGFHGYLAALGVRELPAACCPFDPGLAPVAVASHLAQSGHLMLSLKISMAGWQIAAPGALQVKLEAARRAGVSTTAGGGPYEVAVAQGELERYLDLCAEVGFSAIECGAGFTSPDVTPERIAALTEARGLAFDYELGDKHGGVFDAETVNELCTEGRQWLEAGARRLVIEARESADGIGLFDAGGALKTALAQRLAQAFGLQRVVFEAPTKPSQFALLDQLGPSVQLGNVPMDEVLRVEIYRRGLHSDSFSDPRLAPAPRAPR